MGGGCTRTSGTVSAGKVCRLCKHHSTMPILRPAPRPAGFTLIELVIAVVIAALLAMVALPAYMDYLRKGRRADAHDQSTLISQAQERYRIGHSRFAGAIEELASEGVTVLSAAGHYQAEISESTGVGYTFTVKPVSGGKQAADSQCAEFKVVLLRGGLTRTAKNAGGSDTSTQCWPQ